jgi:hypothetical protein
MPSTPRPTSVDARTPRPATPPSGRGEDADLGGLRWWDSLLLPVIALLALVLLGTVADLARVLVDALG